MENLDNSDLELIEMFNLNTSLDQLIADYYVNRESAHPLPIETGRTNNIRPISAISSTTNNNPQRDGDTSGGSSAPGLDRVSNFSLGENRLLTDDSFNLSNFENLSQLTTVSSASSCSSDVSSLVSVKSDLDSNSKIINIKASRRSMTYDIIFNPPKEESKKEGNVASIRIQTKGSSSSRKEKVNNSSPSSSSQRHPPIFSISTPKPGPGPSKEILLERTVAKLKAKNRELENQVGKLKEKLGQAHETICKLEIEVASFYSNNN